MFTLGMRLGLMGPQYTINMFRSVQYHNTSTPVHLYTLFRRSGGGPLASRCRVVARKGVSCLLRPSYMHSFAMTQHFWVLIEQPLAVRYSEVDI